MKRFCSRKCNSSESSGKYTFFYDQFQKSDVLSWEITPPSKSSLRKSFFGRFPSLKLRDSKQSKLQQQLLNFAMLPTQLPMTPGLPDAHLRNCPRAMRRRCLQLKLMIKQKQLSSHLDKKRHRF